MSVPEPDGTVVRPKQYVEPGILLIPTFNEYWAEEADWHRKVLQPHDLDGDTSQIISAVYDRQNPFRCIQIAFSYLMQVEDQIAEHKRYQVDLDKWGETTCKALTGLTTVLGVWRADIIRRTAPLGMTEKAVPLLDQLKRFASYVFWTLPPLGSDLPRMMFPDKVAEWSKYPAAFDPERFIEQWSDLLTQVEALEATRVAPPPAGPGGTRFFTMSSVSTLPESSMGLRGWAADRAAELRNRVLTGTIEEAADLAGQTWDQLSRAALISLPPADATKFDRFGYGVQLGGAIDHRRRLIGRVLELLDTAAAGADGQGPASRPDTQRDPHGSDALAALGDSTPVAARDLIRLFDLPKDERTLDRLEKRLTEARKADMNCFIETENRQRNKPKFLYYPARVRPVIEALHTSLESPSKKSRS